MLAAGLDPSPPGIQDHEKTPYPKYAEYEITPGDLQTDDGRAKQKWDTYKNPYSSEESKKQKQKQSIENSHAKYILIVCQ